MNNSKYVLFSAVLLTALGAMSEEELKKITEEISDDLNRVYDK